MKKRRSVKLRLLDGHGPQRRLDRDEPIEEGLTLLKCVDRLRYKSIGGSQPMPIWPRFGHAVFRGTAVVQASGFKTKAFLTGSQIKGAAAAYGGALGWSIGDIPSIANYVALFDQFLLERIRLRIKASQNTNATGSGSTLYVVYDADNSNILTGIPAAEDYDTLQELRGSDVGNGESMEIDLVPCVARSTNAGNEIIGATWQDCAVTTNTHYGVKFWYQTVAATDPVWDVEAQYQFAFANLQ